MVIYQMFCTGTTMRAEVLGASPWVARWRAGGNTAPVVVCLHGWLGRGMDWDGVLETLDPRFSCLVLDLPGHGEHRCDPDRLSDWEALSQSLITFLFEELQLDRPVLAGYSLGGRLAVEVMARCPDRVSSLILAGVRPGWGDPSTSEDRLESDRIWADRFRKEWPGILDEWYSQGLFGELHCRPGYEETLLPRRSANDPESVAEALEQWSVARQPDRRDVLRNWAGRTLFLAGDRDRVYRRMGRELEQTRAVDRCQWIEDAGHALLWDQPEQVARHMETFLKED